MNGEGSDLTPLTSKDTMDLQSQSQFCEMHGTLGRDISDGKSFPF